ALRALAPRARVFGCEAETSTPLTAAFAAGHPQRVEHRASFIDGSGSPIVLAEMWPLVQAVLAGAQVASLADVAAAIRVLAERRRVIAEGAGALALAVALSGQAGTGRIVCVVSGGNLDTARLTKILGGEIP